ncbi:hypothetical protein RE628_17660 [Paenibacillus sp. D2_2]|uniref:hypothetical protein n=1 Tax=Paenibacillus sp. D2_2 TaxID=3073092 RepID=UPI0028169DB9|nr:hypothetical protein [Paenibacillus sp. D2_2]WMT39279.1 hypothetical protein RE628_17660 [Paenibacillus sp. D2_2]
MDYRSLRREERAVWAEMILKLDLGLLQIGNSSKVTFNWRVKRYGQIRFKYLASAKRGNGMLFYINGQQVGGEWCENTGWQEAAFTIQPGQMYKFDWLIRKMRPEEWGQNGIYIKDIEVVEIVDTRKPPAPLDYDLDGEEVFSLTNWVVRSTESAVEAHFKGIEIDNSYRSKTMVMELENECEGQISFAYKTGIDGQPTDNVDYGIFFDDQFVSKTQTGFGIHGSYAESHHDSSWVLDGEKSKTKEDNAQITYDIVVGKDCKVDLTGTLEVMCPPRVIDHYEPYNFGVGVDKYRWSMSGNPSWENHGDWLSLNEPKQGLSSASTSLYLPDDGWFIFSFEHELRPTESFEVMVNGEMYHYSKDDRSGSDIKIPLKAGYNTISFAVRDKKTEVPFTYDFHRPFTYGHSTSGRTFTVESPMGSTVDITRDWDVTDGGAMTTKNGDEITYKMSLNPNSSVTITEHMRIFPAMDDRYDPVTGATRDIMVFEELFNTEGTYAPELNFSPKWQWIDIIESGQGSGHGDGVMLAKGHGDTFVANFSAPTMRNPGYICWQYGGKFDPGEFLELQVDGVTVWTGNEENGTKGTDRMYPLPPGSHEFRWVYRDGTRYIPGDGSGSGGSGNGTGGGTGGSGDDPWGEQCYLKGDEVHKLDYGQPKYETGSDRTSAWRWDINGGKQYYDGGTVVSHGVEADGGVITRDFYAPYFGEINYLERLKVYPVKNPKVDNLRRVDTSSMMRDYYSTQTFQTYYYGLPVTNLSPLNNKDKDDEVVPAKELEAKYTRKIFDKVYTSGKFEMSFKYMSYLRNKYQGARLRVWLVSVKKGWEDPIILDNIKENRGTNYKKDYRLLTNNDWATAELWSTKRSLDPGWYWVCIGITDTYPDSDIDVTTKLPWYIAIKDLSIKISDPNSVNEPHTLLDKPSKDNETYVWVRLTDITTGQIVYSQQYFGVQGSVGEYWIDLNQYITPGHAYSVSYTLGKGVGATDRSSGLDTGGFTLSGGKFQEYWDAYCTDANGNVYRKGDSPHPPGGWWTDPPPDIYLDDGNSYAWLDVIRLYENRLDPCPGTRIVIEVYEEGRQIDRWYVTEADDELVKIPVKNDSNEKRDYKVVVRFDQGCPGDGAMIWGGSMDMHDEEPLPESWAEVTRFEVWDNKPIWMGGCDSSNMRVQVLREDGQKVFDQTYYGDDYRAFGVSQLLPTPYTKYKVIITTDQKGTVSSWTGKEYYTIFRVHDFKAYEWYRFIPKPYDAQLDFYIDGVLIKTFTQPGGFYTFASPVPKGKHEFKWVFTTYQEVGERSWEYAQLDWMELTNWICDDVYVTPYCEGGGGDQCIEALIKCLLEIWKSRPKMCVIGKRIWLFT